MVCFLLATEFLIGRIVNLSYLSKFCAHCALQNLQDVHAAEFS